jgi:cation transport ATPase
MTTRIFITSPAVAPTNLGPQGIGETIREAVGEATREAVREARQAQEQARQELWNAQQEVRNAQQQLRDAQQELRDARTADQRGAAEQAMFGAQQELRAAEIELRKAEAQTRSAPVVYTTQAPPMPQPTIPGEVVDLAIGFFITFAVIIVGWPISRAFGRRLERHAAPPALQGDVTQQLQRIEQAVDAIAIEVERISESQRFLTKLQDRSVPAIE